VDYALKRLRSSWALRASAVLSFLCWGGLLALTITGRVSWLQAGQLALLSLATWFFLLWWFPTLEATVRYTAADPSRAWIGRALEIFATSCAIVVHVLMAIMIVVIARS
jgi:hypothetical protein